jgi:Protein of unknown function (DUF2752)
VVDPTKEELGLRLSKKSRILRYGIIGFCTIPLTSSWLYTNGHRFSFVFCPVRHWTGVICPSCGMTRSFMAIARGDWRSAIDYHLFGPLLFIGFGLAIVQAILELSINRRLQIFYMQWLKRRDFQLVMLVSFLGYYLLRLTQIIPSHHI